MLGLPLRERVAMRATIDRRRTASTAGSSTFISHLSERSVIPGNRLERDYPEPGVAAGRTPWSLGGLHPATNVDGTQVEEVDPFVNEEDDLLVGAWQTIGILKETGQVATVMPHQYNRLSLRPVVTGKGDACAGDPFEQIPRAPGIDVPGDPLHERYPLVQLKEILHRRERCPAILSLSLPV